MGHPVLWGCPIPENHGWGARRLRFVVSHPSQKTRRMGHPVLWGYLIPENQGWATRRTASVSGGKLPSGPEGHVDFEALAARVNSCPVTKRLTMGVFRGLLSRDVEISEHWEVIRDQRSEIRDQRSGIRNRGSGIRDQRSGIRDQRSEIGDQRSGIRDRGSGIGDRGSEIRDQKSGIRDQGSGIRDKMFAGRWVLLVYAASGVQ